MGRSARETAGTPGVVWEIFGSLAEVILIFESSVWRANYVWRRVALFLFQHPGIFAATALAAVDDEASAAKGLAGQAAGHDDYFFAVENVRPQIDAAAFEVIFDEAWMLTELHDRL